MNCVIHELGEIIHGYIMFGLATSIVPDGRTMGGFGTTCRGLPGATANICGLGTTWMS